MIDPQTINPLALPFVTLSQRSQLPITPSIYFVVSSDGQVQYIGQSTNPRKRWRTHHKQSNLDVLDAVKITYLDCPEALLDEIEAALIDWYCPPLNDGVPPKFTKRGDRRAVQQSKVKLCCRLQDLLDVQQMTRSGLAQATGLTSAAIRGLCENTAKRYDADTLAVLCGFFGCGMGDLFDVVQKGGQEEE